MQSRKRLVSPDVSRETVESNGPHIFRETQGVETREVAERRIALLSNAELLENGPKDVLDVHPAQQPAQGVGGGTQLFGSQLLALVYKLQAPAQAVKRPMQEIPLARPGHQGALAGPEEFAGEFDQGIDQLRQSITPAGRDGEGPVRAHLNERDTIEQIDLVADRPNRRCCCRRRLRPRIGTQ